MTVRKAKYKKPSLTKAGGMRSNYTGISASVVAAGKAPNLVYFVTPNARTPESWRGGSGVAAHVLGKSTVFNGSFIVRTRSGKMIVVSRSAKARMDPRGMRPHGQKGKWNRGWSKGLYGPPMKQFIADKPTLEAMLNAARTAWPAHWERESKKAIEAARNA